MSARKPWDGTNPPTLPNVLIPSGASPGMPVLSYSQTFSVASEFTGVIGDSLTLGTTHESIRDSRKFLFLLTREHIIVFVYVVQ